MLVQDADLSIICTSTDLHVPGVTKLNSNRVQSVDNQFVDSLINGGVTRYYRVSAVDAKVESELSVETSGFMSPVHEDVIDWNKKIDGNQYNDEAVGVAIDSNDNVYVISNSDDLGGDYSGADSWIKKYFH
ncbi:MAG: SBBP repeat-containing protein [Leptospirales bacterium]